MSGMKLQKQISRKTKKKKYEKWIIAIPNEIINKLGWKERDDILPSISNNTLILNLTKKRSEIPEDKIKVAKYSEKLTDYENFMNVYNNLPLGERRQVVVFMDNQPITWEIAKEQIRFKTDLAIEILKKLRKLKII